MIFITRTLTLLWLLSAAPLTSAHEGHDHGAEEAPVAQAQAAPRFAVRSEAMEVVGVLNAGQLQIYLDRAGDNSPIADASIEIESPALTGTASHRGNGVYQLDAKALNQPGKHALTLTIQSSDLADLLPVTLDVPAAVADPSASRWRGGWLWSLLLLPLLALSGWWWRRRQSKKI